MLGYDPADVAEGTRVATKLGLDAALKRRGGGQRWSFVGGSTSGSAGILFRWNSRLAFSDSAEPNGCRMLLR